MIRSVLNSKQRREEKMLKDRKKSFEAELRPSQMFVVREVKRAQHHNIASVHRLCLLSLLSHSTQDSTTTHLSWPERSSSKRNRFFLSAAKSIDGSSSSARVERWPFLKYIERASGEREHRAEWESKRREA